MQNTEIRLDGLWHFGFSEHQAEPPCDTVCPVPACVNALPGNFAFFGYAAFQRRVRIGGRVRLRLTAGLHARVLWDGMEVGQTQLAWTREEFDFEAGAEMEHALTIYTDNIMSKDASSVFKPNYDFFGYCGLFDDVTIERLAPGFIDRLDVTPLAAQPGYVLLRIHAVAPCPQQLEIAFDGAASTACPWQEEMTLPVPNWQYWSPDSPHLHTVDVNGSQAEFGFRFLDWSGRRLKLNGQEIKLFGVNRHEAHPEFGAATPEPLIWNDLLSIKRQGFNFIRGSHYPQREFMLRCADRLGLLVWEEALGWGNRAADLQDATFMARQQEQCRKMVRKSYNHPSVIIWGFLNECDSTAEESVAPVLGLRDTLHALDQTRPVSFATFRLYQDKCIEAMDLITINTYPDWYDANETAADYDAITRRMKEVAAHYGDKPILFSEIGCGALYGDHNEVRWSEEYQAGYIARVLENVRDMDEISGVSIWQFCDTRTHITTNSITGVPRCFNNKGLVNEYRQPKLAWRTAGKILKED